MNYINIYGLVFILVIMIPNIVFAIKNKDGFCNVWRNRVAETFEKIHGTNAVFMEQGKL